MANEEQLRILKEDGVEAWNKWRQENPRVKPDLSRVNLIGANLRRADLRGANLKEVDLRRADLRGANLTEAYLRKSNLCFASLESTNFSGADIREAKLMWVKLSKANLRKAKLSKANLYGVNLYKANLSETNLSGADLSRTQALYTNFYGTTFTGACLENWNINNETNLEKVICDYIYLKIDKQERRPSEPNRNFAPGEFTKLFQKALTTVDLIFLDGIDWKAFLLSFKELQDEYREENVGVQAIERKSDGAFVVRIEVPAEADKAEIESYTKKSYETNLKVLEAQYRLQLQAKDEQIAIYRQHNTDLLDIIKLKAIQPIQNIIDITSTAERQSMSEAHKSKYDLSHANVGGIVDTAQSGSHQEFTQHNYAPEQKQTLAEAADEIQKLLKQLEQTNPNATPEQQQAYVDAAIPPTLKERCISALKAGGETAIEEFLDNPYVNVGKAIVMAWIQPQSN